jgi:hypothetical protein
MSDELAPEPVAEPVGSTDVGEANEIQNTPVLSIDEYANYHVPIKVDGEEISIPLTEAISGYQRQADYTRKTQELAQQRQELQFATAIQAALERDPASTIDLLANHYGISRQAAAEMVADNFGEDEDYDPQTAKRISRFEELQTQQEVEKEISRLQTRYEDFDVNEVVTAALRLGTTDLEGTYKQIAFDKFMAQKEIERMAVERQSQEENRIIESKRAASVIEGGSSATSNTTNEPMGAITSVQDAWFAAKSKLNANL